MTLLDLFLFDITPPEVHAALCQDGIWQTPLLEHSLGGPYVTLSVETDDRGRKDTATIARIGGQDGIDVMQDFLRTIGQTATVEALEIHRSSLPATTPTWFTEWRSPKNVGLISWERHVHHSVKIMVGGVCLTSTFFVVRMD